MSVNDDDDERMMMMMMMMLMMMHIVQSDKYTLINYVALLFLYSRFPAI